MNSSDIVRIETLNRENYDTWKMQMRALLVKNDEWSYVSGKITKLEVIFGDTATMTAAQEWASKDEKAKSDIILSIGPTQLKLIKNCETSRELWLKLEGT